MEVMEMAEKWRVSEYLGGGEFDTLKELLDALEAVGVNTDVLQEVEEKDGRRVLRTRAYTVCGIALIMEAFHDEFDERAWLRNPSWKTIAEALEEEEEVQEKQEKMEVIEMTKHGVMMQTRGEWQGYGVEITLYRDGVLGVLVYSHTIPPTFALAMTDSGKWEIYNPRNLPLPPLDQTMVDFWGWSKLTDWLKQNGTDVEEVFPE